MRTGDLVDAVRAHRAVELRYRGQGARVVHPHAVYRTSSGGLRVEGVQVSGATSSGSLPGWRDFELMRISDLRVLDVEFEPAPDFDRGAQRYRHGLIALA
jgi:predicted DNA-binding transcriptional regulator YafY